MSDAIRIHAGVFTSVFVDKYDEGSVWLSIQTPHGSANCTIPVDQVKVMIDALQAAIKEQA